MNKNDGASSLVRSDALLADLVIVEELARLAPELIPSNYDHDDVCRLNTAMNELYEVVRKYKPTANARALAEERSDDSQQRVVGRPNGGGQ